MKQKSLRIILIGWNENGEKCLTKLLSNNHTIVQVILPKNYETEPMVKICKKAKVPCMEYEKENGQLEEIINKKKPDLIVVASYPSFFTRRILSIPKFGVINVHTGELPKYRGFHPLNWALIRDEERIGVTVHYMDEGMDTGDVLAQETIQITNHDDINTVKERITTVGAKLLTKVVNKIRTKQKKLEGIEQQDSKVLFAPKRKPQDGKIKWTNSSREIFNLVRALKQPYPQAFGKNQNDDTIKFESSYISNKCGEVLAKIKGHYLISTGDGVILLKTKENLEIGEVLK